jgi:propanediol dehydratase small subunit
MYDALYLTRHAADRAKHVPQAHMIADLLFRFGSEDHRGRLSISAKELTAVAAEARASGLHKLARDIERAARVAFVLAGDILITLFHVTEPDHLSSRYNYRRRSKQASQYRRQMIA